MEKQTSNGSKILAVFICLAMILSTTVIISDKTSAEIVTGNELYMPETPPVPPYTIYGILDKYDLPVSDATVTITNLRTGESLDADVYENGAYEGILEDLPSGYAVDDMIEIAVEADSATTSKTIVVEQMGFGKRVDFNLGDNERNLNSENTLASSKIQNNVIETTIMSNIESSPSLNTWPERNTENPEPIIIDSIRAIDTNTEQEPDIVLVDIRCPPGYRYALDGQKSMVNLTLGNIGDVRYIVIAELTNIKPDGSEEFIDTLTFGAIMPGHEKTKRTFWTPDTIGENYIRIDISIREKREIIPLTSYEASFYVVPSENVLYWHSKEINEPQEFYDMTIISFGGLDINAETLFRNCTVVIDPIVGSQTISAETTWMADTWLMDTQVDGATWINVTETGTLNILLGSDVTTTDTTTPKRYQFLVNGALNIDSSTIEYVWGNTSDLSQPGGIQIYDTNNVNITGNSVIRNGATHGIWLQNSDAVITGSYIQDNGGDGIVVVDGSAPQIEGNTVEWNGRYGIRANDSLPAITGGNTIQYNRQDGIFVDNVTSAEGKPSYVPGTDLGYFIWHDENGWHLRMSGDGTTNYFNATITMSAGFANSNFFGLEGGDSYGGTATSIWFNLTEGSGEDSLDFNITGDTLIFDLWLNDAYVTSSVFIGPGGSNPVSIPFTLVEGVTISGNSLSDNFASGLHLVNTNIAVTDNTLSSNGLDPVFEDDFEIDVGWINESLWHRVNNESGIAPSWNLSHSRDWSYWYGQDAAGNYSTGSRTYGNLTSTNINVQNATTAALTFWSWYETDTTTDQRKVIVRSSTAEWNTTLSGDSMGEWTRYVVNISQFAGSFLPINITFYFDTIDDLDNGYLGWYIDDVEVITAYPVLEGHGIHLEGKTPALIYNNTITSNNWYGVYSDKATQIRINHNVISNNNRGIYGLESHDASIENNTIRSNKDEGVFLYQSFSGKIFNNTVSENSPGIYLFNSPPSTISSLSSTNSLSMSPAYKKDSILFKFRPSYLQNNMLSNGINEIETKLDATVERISSSTNVIELKLNSDKNVDKALEILSEDPRVLYAEPDFLISLEKTPNDLGFDSLWGLHNTGQTDGAPDADINAPEAWNISTGSGNVVVAVIDTGVDYNHPDLIDNMWNNPGETGPDGLGGYKENNSIDDDGNGYIDDIHGINAIIGSGNPLDDHGHGTHCAGTIGAIGNNSIGVAGVNWDVSIMALKFLKANGGGYTSDAIECIDYVIMMKENGTNINITSNSWGGGGYNQALYDAIANLRDAGILFVAAAGNAGINTDIFPHYPSSYNLTNIISVAATDHNDSLAYFSNYGASSVDVAAPGVKINSTLLGNSYGKFSGTSMAAPHVSGLAALIASENPSYDYTNIKNLILTTVDQNQNLSNKLVTGGRVNAYNALSYTPGGMKMLIHSPGNDSKVLKGVRLDVVVSVSDGVQPITNANVTVEFSSGEPQLNLSDDGSGVDQDANDGYYSGFWMTPDKLGGITLSINVNKSGYQNISKDVLITMVAGNVISNNTIIDNQAQGLSLSFSSHNIFSGNTFSNNTNEGIRLTYSDDNLITDNNISKNDGKGILTLWSSRNTITDNTLTNNKHNGIRLHWMSNSNISYNNVSSNGLDGICVTSSIGLNIIKSNIANNNNLSGISHDDSYDDVISDNIVNNNSMAGIFLIGYSSSNNISNNNANNNKYGIAFDINSNSYGDIIFENNVAYNDYGIAAYLFPPPPIGGITSNHFDNTELLGSDIPQSSSVFNQLSIIKNNISHNNYDGIYLESEGFLDILPIQVEGNHILNNSRGVYIVNISSTLIGNEITHNQNTGIYINSSCNNTIANNTINGNSRGIYILNASVSGEEYYVENETVYGPSVGGELGPISLTNGNVIDCTLYGFLDDGWTWLNENSDYFLNYITGEIDVTPIVPMSVGWTFYAYYNYTIRISDNILINNIISDNTEVGIYCNRSPLVIQDNSLISNNSYGIYTNLSSLSIINSTISNSTYDDFYLDTDSHATTLNTTFNKTKVYFNDDLSTLTVQWFMDVRVVNETYAPVPNTSIWVNDTFGNPVISSTTPDGRIRWIRATEYVQDQTTTTYHTAHNITVSNATLTGWAMPEPYMDTNREVYVFLGAGKGYNIFLHEGWNFVSIPYQPFNMSPLNMGTVLTTINGKWDYILYYDNSDPVDKWKTNATFKPWILNDLTHINHTMGFWINILEDCTLFSIGERISPVNITLHEGWNMVGYPTENRTTNISTAFVGIASNIDSIEAFDETAEYNMSPVSGDYIMRPGDAYWVKVNTDCVWTVDW